MRNAAMHASGVKSCCSGGVDVLGYLIRRLLLIIPTLLTISLVVFLMLELLPGNVVGRYHGEGDHVRRYG